MIKFFRRCIDFLYDRVLYPIMDCYKRQYQKIHYKRLRNKLKTTEFSLFSPNCYAGLIYHRLGVQFQSPTINLLFPIKKQYLKFLSNLEYYLNQTLLFVEDPNYSVPVAMLDDIKLVFVHYHSQKEAEEAWNKRKTRVNYKKMLFIFDDIADAEYEDLLKFCELDCAGKVILTANNYEDIPCAIQIKKYAKDKTMKPYLLDTNKWTGNNAADRYFDFVEWINESL